MIYELSLLVIIIKKDVVFLLLVGDIDMLRVKLILESML